MSKTTTAVSRLEDALKRLKPDQGRIARKNARRIVLGALAGVRNALDKDFPTIQKPPKQKKAKVPHWREYEKTMRVPDLWDNAKAEAFHMFFCLEHSILMKPIHWFERGSKLLGQHCTDKIRLRGGMTPEQTWRTFLHELAHYHIHHHKKTFTIEFMHIYKLFRTWQSNGGLQFTEKLLDQRMNVAIQEVTDGVL